MFEESKLDRGKMSQNYDEFLWYEVRNETTCANAAVSPPDSERDKRSQGGTHAETCANFQQLSFVFTIMSTAS